MRYLKMGMDDYPYIYKEDKFLSKDGRVSTCYEQFSCNSMIIVNISESGHRKRKTIGVSNKEWKVGNECDEVNNKGHLV